MVSRYVLHYGSEMYEIGDKVLISSTQLDNKTADENDETAVVAPEGNFFIRTTLNIWN